MTVRQLFNEVDEIQCEAIIQQYDYEKNDSQIASVSWTPAR